MPDRGYSFFAWKIFFLALFYTLSLGKASAQTDSSFTGLSLVILGTMQDAGSPQISCKKDCCKDLFGHPDTSRNVVSLGIIDAQTKKTYLLEATPDIGSQLNTLNRFANLDPAKMPDGIFLTHAHIGHYSGLMYLGREAVNASKVPVFTMPRMKSFLENNGPWSQLVSAGNISLQQMNEFEKVKLSSGLTIQPILVPHRDEYSETVGYLISGNTRRALFIPDIDKWEKWKTDIGNMIPRIDYVFIDGTFFDAEEINNRNISEIPHPFIIESLDRFKGLDKTEKAKIRFIHFNHTNPLLKAGSPQRKQLLEQGFQIAEFGQVYRL